MVRRGYGGIQRPLSERNKILPAQWMSFAELEL